MISWNTGTVNAKIASRYSMKNAQKHKAAMYSKKTENRLPSFVNMLC